MKIQYHYLLVLSIGLVFGACTNQKERKRDDLAEKHEIFPVSFDGANYTTNAEKVLHGNRLAILFACNSCHSADYSGLNFGEVAPMYKGLWATNISLTLPEMKDAELERLLRTGVHPARDLFIMPSKQTQFLSERDMTALVAFLRTIPAVGAPTPVPPPGFRDSVSSKLPADYWRTDEKGNPAYHTSEDEVLYYRKNVLPDLGEEFAKGRVVAQSICTACHGAALDGVGESGGDIQKAKEYDVVSYKRLLREAVAINGDTLEIPYSSGHTPPELSDNEIQAVIAYTQQLIEKGGAQKHQR